MLRKIFCTQRVWISHSLRLPRPENIVILRTISRLANCNNVFCYLPKNNRFYSAEIATGSTLHSLKYEKVCEETLESLCDYFEELVENCSHLKGSDVMYGDGVLTVQFGEPFGTYVINRQSPNKQIWLSSPTSGPKRYDFIAEGEGYWVYKHDGVPLHRLLQEEITKIIKQKTQFEKCSHSSV